MYAGDTELYLLMDDQLHSSSDALAETLEVVTGWLQQSQLKLNPLRCLALLAGVCPFKEVCVGVLLKRNRTLVAPLHPCLRRGLDSVPLPHGS